VFGQIRIDPTNPETVYILGVPLSRSTDGGKTFSGFAQGVHGDHHGLWIDPANTNVIYSNNDGGFYQTADGGKTWKFAVAAGGSQFYNVALDTSSPPWAYGSIQDIGSRRGRIDFSKGRGAIPAAAWENAPGGEGSNHAIDPQNPNIVYSHGFYGNFSRTDLGAAGRWSERRARRRVDVNSAHRSNRRAPGAVDGAIRRLSTRRQHRLCGLPVPVQVHDTRRQVGKDQR
jgi:photosystem II stability/assembly factor-like uncharacterized protein